MEDKLILITGGHVTPAIACIEELQKRSFKSIIYVGQKHSILFDKNLSSEYKVIKDQLNLDFISYHPGKFSRYFEFASLIWWIRIPIGFIEALFILLKQKPNLILTFGSHVGLPFAILGKLLGIKIIAHEQTRSAGFSIRLIKYFSDLVCYSWKDENLFGEKFMLTGNPLRKSVFVTHDKLLEFNNSKKTILITGGNQGSHVINEKVFNGIDKLLSKFNIIHQTGSNTLFNDYERAKEIKNHDYLPKNYFSGDEFYQALDQADYVIARGGANTLCELIVKKKKAIIIPIPNSSGNEQLLNAKLLEEVGLAKIILQKDLEQTDLHKAITELVSKELNETDIQNLIELHKNAQVKIIDLLEEMLQK